MSQVINGSIACEHLKKCISWLEKAYTDSTDAKTKIQSNLSGEEFQLARNYINDNITVAIKNQIDEIDSLGMQLVKFVNNYNDTLTDADGNKIPFKRILWSNNSFINSETTVGNASSNTADLSTTPLEDENADITPEIPLVTPPLTPTLDKVSASEKYNYHAIKDDDLDQIVDSILSNNMTDNCLENTTIKYNNNYYLWSDISNKIIEKLNLNNKVKTITFINKSFVLKMSDGNSYKTDNIKNYNDLILLLKKI